MADSTAPNNGNLTTVEPARLHSPEQRKEIVKRLLGIASAVGETLNQDRLDLYLQALADIPYVTLLAYLDLAPLECFWFPKIPEIRRECGLGPKNDRERETEADALAETAWSEALEFARFWHPDRGHQRYTWESGFRHGPERQLPGQTMERVAAQIGGWYRIWAARSTEDTEEASFVRKEFIQAWKALGLAERLKLRASPEEDRKLLEQIADDEGS